MACEDGPAFVEKSLRRSIPPRTGGGRSSRSIASDGPAEQRQYSDDPEKLASHWLHSFTTEKKHDMMIIFCNEHAYRPRL